MNGRPAAGNGHGLQVSVVIPTYKRTDLLERCIDALLAQSLSRQAYEIVVCDDGPDVMTRALVADRAAACADDGPRLRYVPVRGTQGPAGARNAGWRIAQAPVIAFTDDDTIPDPAWLASGLCKLRERRADAVTGRVRVPLPSAPTDYERDAAGLDGAEFVTANCFVSRAMLERVGGFDERYTSAWREDSDLQFSILKAGGTMARAVDAVVVHPVRPAPWGVSLSQQRKSQFEALLYKKHPRYYRERVPPPPWHYYGIVLALTVAALAALSGYWDLAMAMLAAWTALTARFCARRLRDTTRRPSHVAEMLWTSMLIPPLSVYWRARGAIRFRVAFL